MNQTLSFELDGLKEGAKTFKEGDSITFSLYENLLYTNFET